MWKFHTSARTPWKPVVCTAILLFTKTNSGGTDHVWFYDMKQDGFSLDDRRTPQPDKSDIPDILKRWKNLAKGRK